MSRFTNTLARVRVAAPCEADWDEMRGDERVRFCQHCSLNVYNLSAMTKREAERLVTRTEGTRLCVRFYRRKDGTMLTQPCPVGLRALKRRVSRISSAVFAGMMGFMAGVGLAPEKKKTFPVMPPAVSPVEPAAEQQFTLAEGGMDFEPAPDAGGPLGVLVGISLLCGYPLRKFRAWQESQRGERLHIWRNM
jgi:hypothetical protein